MLIKKEASGSGSYAGSDKEDFGKVKKTFESLFSELEKVIVGQKEVMEQLVASILADSNTLIEGYPGLGKTLMIKTLAETMDLKFSRIQNTPDLMPSDITGTEIIEEVGGKRFFKFQPGPVFANVVLADEINRATPKSQSALLEAMQEKQVTISNKTYKLDLPFFVLATQNPIEQEGTYPLPEAQADRFLLKIKIGYPDYEDEIKIATQYTKRMRTDGGIKKVLSKHSVLALQNFTRQMPMANDIVERAVKIVTATRQNKEIEYGASPRASIGLILAAKAKALIMGRAHVSEKDINDMAFPILRHRIILNFEAERKGMREDDVIKQIVEKA